MIITSHSFLLAFLPVSYLLFWHLAKSKQQRLVILSVSSFVFYYWAASYFVVLLFATSLCTFLFSRRKWNKLGIAANLIPLLIYKFLASNTGGATIFNPELGALIPLGISYYTFKHIGYLIDVEQRRIPASGDLLEFLAFSSFFAQIVAGPISSFAETSPQYSNLQEKPSRQRLYIALAFITFGLAKKLFISDVLSQYLAVELARMNAPGFFQSWGVLIVFSLEIYFNFTGYTDLALGIGLLFGLELPPNFNSPFLATSPRDFWNRWHMSLSYWFRYYVYFPFSRAILKVKGRQHVENVEYLAAFTTMFLIGIWHNFSLGFTFWGLYNGLLLSLQSWGERRKIVIAPLGAARVMLIFSILLGFSFLVYADISSTFDLWAGLLGANGWGSLHLDTLTLMTTIIAVALVIGGVSESANLDWGQKGRHAIVVGVLASLCILFLGTGIIAFTYANF